MQGAAFNLRRRRRRPTINLTSLIDVMFLLIIFFTVSSTFREQIGIDVALPPASTARQQDLPPNTITVTRDGALYFGQQLVDANGLRESLHRLVEETPNPDVVLRADEGADFGNVVRAIDIAREVGGARLIIPTAPPEEGGAPG